MRLNFLNYFRSTVPTEPTGAHIKRFARVDRITRDELEQFLAVLTTQLSNAICQDDGETLYWCVEIVHRMAELLEHNGSARGTRITRRGFYGLTSALDAQELRAIQERNEEELLWCFSARIKLSELVR